MVGFLRPNFQLNTFELDHHAHIHSIYISYIFLKGNSWRCGIAPDSRACGLGIASNARVTAKLGSSLGDSPRKREILVWDRETTKRYYEAGGGQGFDAEWSKRLAEARESYEAIAAGRLHSAGGCLTYLVSGRKPPP